MKHVTNSSTNQSSKECKGVHISKISFAQKTSPNSSCGYCQVQSSQGSHALDIDPPGYRMMTPDSCAPPNQESPCYLKWAHKNMSSMPPLSLVHGDPLLQQAGLSPASPSKPYQDHQDHSATLSCICSRLIGVRIINSCSSIS